MRVRQRPPVLARWNGIGARYQSFTGGPVTDVPVSRTCEISHELMWDEPFGGERDKSTWHTRIEFKPVIMDGLISYDWNKVWAYGLPPFAYSQGPAVIAVSAAEKDSLLTELVRQWTNTPPPIIQLGEYLTQFKQTVKIPVAAAKLLTADSVWRPWARNHLKGRGILIDAFATIRNPALKKRVANETLANIKQSMKYAPRNVSNAFLLWSFGINPLLSDLAKARKVVPTVLSRLRRLRDNNGVWTKHRIRRVFVRDVPSKPTVFGAHEFQHAILGHGVACSLSADVRTQYEGLNECIGELEGTQRFGVRGFLAVAQALGLGNAPLVAWNAIPFSFVADWCSRVGDHLDKYGLAQAEGTYETKNPLTSEKAWGTFQWLYGNQCPSYSFGGVTRYNSPYVVGTGEYEHYSRSLSLPQPSFSPVGFTPGQQMLLTALFTQRVPVKA